ncbi:MAG: hypothetical protein AB7U05_00970 [Mangrovibacterium sp.]
MKTIITIIQRASLLLLLCVPFLFEACNDEFLEENASQSFLLQDTLYVTEKTIAQEITLGIPEAKNANYTIRVIPKWLEIAEMEGTFDNGYAKLYVSVVALPEFNEIGFYEGALHIYVEGKGTYYGTVFYARLGDPTITVQPAIVEFGTDDYATVTVSNTTANSILLWEIQELPNWLNANATNGMAVQNGSNVISFWVNRNNLEPGVYNHNLVLWNNSSNEKFILPVSMKVVGPSMSVSPAQVDLGASGTVAVTISNATENSTLHWSIKDLPPWLLVSQTDGTTTRYQNSTITFSVNRENLDLGVYTHDLVIENDSENKTFVLPVRMEVVDFMDDALTTLLEGHIVDAEYHEGSGILAIITQTPKLLQLFHTNTNTLESFALESVPACISLAEDGSELLIGNTNATISRISLANPTVHQTFEIDCIPYDIVFGSNNWCYITPTLDQWVHFRSLNLQTGELVKSSSSSAIYEKTIIRKIPNKDMLLGTRTGLSPSGILLFDTSQGICNENINYWHEGIGNFWLTEDGSKFVCSTGRIYRTPDYTDDYVHSIDISPIGDLGTNWDAPIKWTDHSAAANTLFVLRAAPDYYTNNNDSWIESYDAYSYEKLATYRPMPVVLTIGGVRKEYETKASFVFASNDETAIYVLKNVNQSYSIGNQWAIEKMITGD